MNKITLAEVAEAMRAFEVAPENNELREAAIAAIQQYEIEHNMSTLEVLKAVRKYDNENGG